ncbi:hypothetical protein O3P69_011555 [Scylla paramamosain]|uniref:Uncharacterized protein n=1 Tax=Scylla paramamosain TaxID=85552 RepID=A0AAW0T7B5_SCYPA
MLGSICEGEMETQQSSEATSDNLSPSTVKGTLKLGAGSSGPDEHGKQPGRARGISEPWQHRLTDVGTNKPPIVRVQRGSAWLRVPLWKEAVVGWGVGDGEGENNYSHSLSQEPQQSLHATRFPQHSLRASHSLTFTSRYQTVHVLGAILRHQ